MYLWARYYFDMYRNAGYFLYRPKRYMSKSTILFLSTETIRVEMNDTFCIVPVDTYDTLSIEVGDMYHRSRHFSNQIEYCIGIENDIIRAESIVATVKLYKRGYRSLQKLLLDIV